MDTSMIDQIETPVMVAESLEMRNSQLLPSETPEQESQAVESQDDGPADLHQQQKQQLSSIEAVTDEVDEDEDEVFDPQKFTPYELLQHRREESRDIYNKSLDLLKDEDVCYAIPAQWYEIFLNYEFDQDDQDIESKLGPINTNCILDNSGLILQEDKYAFVPEPVFVKLCEWFGLDEGCNPVERSVYTDHTGRIQVDSHPLYIVPHILCGSAELINRYRLANAKPFLISARSSAKDLKETVKKHFDISKGQLSRIWQVKADTNDLPTIMMPSMLNQITSKTLIASGKKTGFKSLTEKEVAAGDIMIELQQSDGSFLMDRPSKLVLGNGLVGLNNLGNTCYMNSALQCLVHIPELANYFLYDFYEQEINVDNPLGNNGKVAISFGTLIKHLFDSRLSRNLSSYGPRDFKYTIGYFNSMFSDYHQQDSQELIAFLLDGLHEDLNRILKKPYVEKPELTDDKVNNPEEVKKLAMECWESHKLRNNSIIIDLFVGLYKSTLVCPECNKVSITFDPYNDLTLPLPISKKWTGKVKILLEEGFPKEFEVELDKSSTFADLKSYISEKLNVPQDELIALEVFQSQVYRNFEAKDSDTRYLPISDVIGSSDDIWFYQVKHTPGDLVVPVFNTIGSDKRYNMSKSFGIPFFITVSEEDRYSYGSIREKLEKRYAQLSTYNYFQQIRSQAKYKYTIEDFPLLKIAERQEIEFVSDNDDDAKSDISLANPDLPGNYGFSIKLFDSSREVRKGYGKYSRFMYGGNFGYPQKQKQRRLSADEDEEDDSLWIPHTNENFKNLPDLLDRISPRRRAFYTYQGIVASDESTENQQTEQQQRPEKESIVEHDGMKLGADNWEMVSQPVSPATNSNELVDVNGSEGSSATGDVELPTDIPLAPLTGVDVDTSPVDGLESSYVQLDSDTKMHSDDSNESPVIINHDDGDLKQDQSEDEDEQEDEENEEEEDPYNKFLIEEKNALVCEWDPQLFDTFFTGIEDEGEGGKETWTNLEKLPNQEVEENRRRLSESLKKHISLDDCIDMFCTPEILGENDLWFCPNCKEHREATKKIEIWSVPDILTIHLKRFENTKSFSDKIDAVVDFPIEGLDLTKYVVGQNGEELVYDLFAVDNHYGGLGGGHYTSYVKNFVDDKWYYYDDSRVTSANPVDSIKGSAYLLFYRRRSDRPLGGEFFQKMFDAIDQEREKDEKQRLEFEESLKNVSAPADITTLSSSALISTVNSPPPSISLSDCKDCEFASNDIKRRKKMFMKSSNVVDSNVGSPMSDNDDNVSTYSGSALAPCNNQQEGDEIHSDLGDGVEQ